jgi:hypothetical protein
MAGDKNKDAWDDLAEKEAAAQGISPEIARAVLATNPQLREGGMTTDLLIKQGGKPGAAAAQRAAGKPIEAGESLADLAKLLDKRLTDAKQKREKELADAEQRFVGEKKAMLDALVQWLAQRDPELRSPFTQQVLEQKKALLAAIGFDVKAYVASRMKGR